MVVAVDLGFVCLFVAYIIEVGVSVIAVVDTVVALSARVFCCGPFCSLRF